MKVKIYSTHACPYCKMLKSWLDGKKIKYENVFVDENTQGMEEMLKVSEGHMGVPYTVITRDDGSSVKIAGFDKVKFKEIVG